MGPSQPLLYGKNSAFLYIIIISNISEYFGMWGLCRTGGHSSNWCCLLRVFRHLFLDFTSASTPIIHSHGKLWQASDIFIFQSLLSFINITNIESLNFIFSKSYFLALLTNNFPFGKLYLLYNSFIRFVSDFQKNIITFW